MTSKVGVYVRVSTLDRQEKGEASQDYIIQQYNEAHGIEAQWFRDRLTGGDTDRPAFKQLQKAIFAGKIKTVIVWKLDRLSRSQRDGINVLCDWLERDVRIVSVSQQLDFSGAVGRLVAGVLFAVAEMERENIRSNIMRGLAAAKAKGVKLGRRPSFSAADVAPLLAEGMSVIKAAETLKVSRASVYRVMKAAK